MGINKQYMKNVSYVDEYFKNINLKKYLQFCQHSLKIYDPSAKLTVT